MFVVRPYMSYASSAPSFDPTTMDLTGYWRGSYTGAPWVGTASAGVSGTRNLVQITDAPSVGTAKNGYTPASFDGVAECLSGANNMEDFVGSGAYTSLSVLQVDSGALPSDATVAFACPQIWSQDNGNAGIAISTGGFRFWIFDSIESLKETAVATVSDWSAWHVVVCRYTGAVFEISLNGAAFISETAASPGTFGIPLEVGRNYDSTAFFTGFLMEQAFMTSSISDTNASNYRSYAISRYAL